MSRSTSARSGGRELLKSQANGRVAPRSAAKPTGAQGQGEAQRKRDAAILNVSLNLSAIPRSGARRKGFPIVNTIQLCARFAFHSVSSFFTFCETVLSLADDIGGIECIITIRHSIIIVNNNLSSSSLRSQRTDFIAAAAFVLAPFTIRAHPKDDCNFVPPLC